MAVRCRPIPLYEILEKYGYDIEQLKFNSESLDYTKLLNVLKEIRSRNPAIFIDIDSLKVYECDDGR